MENLREINLSLRPTKLEMSSFPASEMHIDPFWEVLLEERKDK